MRRAFSILVLLVFPAFAFAQEPVTPHEEPRPIVKQRLKIGVALEGGGALGLAHIGVLQWFEALPVPFRCVATDLVSAKQFVFKDGSLAEALRATMSIPGAFTPVHDGQHVYVDGGLVNNLPTDVVRQMGADIVIAVHLETQPAQAKDIQSLLSVLEQSVRAVISESELPA